MAQISPMIQRIKYNNIRKYLKKEVKEDQPVYVVQQIQRNNGQYRNQRKRK